MGRAATDRAPVGHRRSRAGASRRWSRASTPASMPMAGKLTSDRPIPECHGPRAAGAQPQRYRRERSVRRSPHKSGAAAGATGKTGPRGAQPHCRRAPPRQGLAQPLSQPEPCTTKSAPKRWRKLARSNKPPTKRARRAARCSAKSCSTRWSSTPKTRHKAPLYAAPPRWTTTPQGIAVQQRFIADQDRRSPAASIERFDDELERLRQLWPDPRAPQVSASQLAAQEVVDLLRVGLAFAGLHGLADQGVEVPCRCPPGTRPRSWRWPRSRRRRSSPARRVSLIWLRPLASMTASTWPPSPFHSASNTCLRGVVGDGAVGDAADQAPSCAALTGACSMAKSAAFRRRGSSPMTQLPASLGCAAGLCRGFEVTPQWRRLLGQRAVASYSLQGRTGVPKRVRHRARQLGHVGCAPGPPSRRINHQRRQVRVGEVAVVGGVFLGAHGAGFAGVGVEQHRGLLDGVAVFDLLDLPAHLVVDGLLHEA